MLSVLIDNATFSEAKNNISDFIKDDFFLGEVPGKRAVWGAEANNCLIKLQNVLEKRQELRLDPFRRVRPDEGTQQVWFGLVAFLRSRRLTSDSTSSEDWKHIPLDEELEADANRPLPDETTWKESWSAEWPRHIREAEGFDRDVEDHWQRVLESEQRRIQMVNDERLARLKLFLDTPKDAAEKWLAESDQTAPDETTGGNAVQYVIHDSFDSAIVEICKCAEQLGLVAVDTLFKSHRAVWVIGDSAIVLDRRGHDESFLSLIALRPSFGLYHLEVEVLWSLKQYFGKRADDWTLDSPKFRISPVPPPLTHLRRKPSDEELASLPPNARQTVDKEFLPELDDPRWQTDATLKEWYRKMIVTIDKVAEEYFTAEDRVPQQAVSESDSINRTQGERVATDELTKIGDEKIAPDESGELLRELVQAIDRACQRYDWRWGNLLGTDAIGADKPPLTKIQLLAYKKRFDAPQRFQLPFGNDPEFRAGWFHGTEPFPDDIIAAADIFIDTLTPKQFVIIRSHPLGDDRESDALAYSQLRESIEAEISKLLQQRQPTTNVAINGGGYGFELEGHLGTITREGMTQNASRQLIEKFRQRTLYWQSSLGDKQYYDIHGESDSRWYIFHRESGRRIGRLELVFIVYLDSVQFQFYKAPDDNGEGIRYILTEFEKFIETEQATASDATQTQPTIGNLQTEATTLIPSRPADLARWKATWRAIKEMVERAMPIDSIISWLENSEQHKHLACHPDTLEKIIKAGKAELLKDS